MSQKASDKQDVATLQAAILLNIQRRLQRVEQLLEEQRSHGEVYPLKVTVTDSLEGIRPRPGGLWKCVSVYNSGDKDCSITLVNATGEATEPIPIGARVSKDFEFTHDVISVVYAKTAKGESTTLEVEFKR